VTHNPANLVFVEHAEVALAPSFVNIHVKYRDDQGQPAETRDPWKILPNIFVAGPVLTDRFAAGLAITTPYGLSNEWEQSGAFADPFRLRYTAPHFTELKVINANPAFSAKLSETLSVGVGLNVFWSELTFKQFYPWVAFPGGAGMDPDGRAKAQGDGFGVGGNAGITWEFMPGHRLAATYRSPVTVNYEGRFEIDNVPARAAGFGATSRSQFESRIQFPTIVAVGYGVQITDTIRLETDIEWLQFSNFDTLPLNLGNNAFLLPYTEIRQDWKDTFTAGIGGDWRFSPNWVLRAGYQFYESPVPDRTFSPTIPDANQHVLTVGLGYTAGRHHIEAAYGADFYDRRHIQNNQVPAFNGTYDISVHLFALSYQFSF
jgi:long-chain fatty acid transport protein